MPLASPSEGPISFPPPPCCLQEELLSRLPPATHRAIIRAFLPLAPTSPEASAISPPRHRSPPPHPVERRGSGRLAAVTSPPAPEEQQNATVITEPAPSGEIVPVEETADANDQPGGGGGPAASRQPGWDSQAASLPSSSVGAVPATSSVGRGLFRAMGDAFRTSMKGASPLPPAPPAGPLEGGAVTAPATGERDLPLVGHSGGQEGSLTKGSGAEGSPVSHLPLHRLLQHIARQRGPLPLPSTYPASVGGDGDGDAGSAKVGLGPSLLLPHEVRLYRRAISAGRGTVSERMHVAALVAGDEAEARFWSHLPATLRYWGKGPYS